MIYVGILFKVLCIVIFAIYIRGTLPRYRYDQLVQITWRQILFYWLGLLVITAVGSYFYLILLS